MSARPEDTRITNTAFQIMKLALTGDMTAIDGHLSCVFAESGTAGLLKISRALAMAALILRPDLRETMPTLGPALLASDDARSVLDEMFTFLDNNGQPHPFADEDMPVLVTGLLFLHACVIDSKLTVERFRYAAVQGKSGIGELIGGILIILTAVLRSLPEGCLEELENFQPGTQAHDAPAEDTPAADTSADSAATPGSPESPGTSTAPVAAPVAAPVSVAADTLVPFAMPDTFADKLLAAARHPDPEQAARLGNTLIVPLLLLHGEPALLTVCRILCAALAELFGISPNSTPDGPRIVLSGFTDETGAPTKLDLSDPFVRLQMLAYEFLTAYLNLDHVLQRRLMRRYGDGGGTLVNGLTGIYRAQHEAANRTQDTKER